MQDSYRQSEERAAAAVETNMRNIKISRCRVGMIQTNCYLAMNQKTGEAFIVDPGDEALRIENALSKMEAKPTAILLTHAHFDHILAVNELKQKYAIPVYAFKEEEETLLDPDKNLSGAHGCPTVLKADRLLSDEEAFSEAGFVIRCLHTPGHTPGSCCYYLPDENILFSGDTLFCGSVGRTDFPGGSMAEIVRSLHRLVEELPEQTDVLPGHDQPTTIGEEKKYNPFMG